MNGRAHTTEADALAARTARHFAHKVPVTTHDGATAIETRFGVVVLRPEEGLLAIRLEPLADEGERLRAVVEAHLRRFAREPIRIEWTDVGG